MKNYPSIVLLHINKLCPATGHDVLLGHELIPRQPFPSPAKHIRARLRPRHRRDGRPLSMGRGWRPLRRIQQILLPQPQHQTPVSSLPQPVTPTNLTKCQILQILHIIAESAMISSSPAHVPEIPLMSHPHRPPILRLNLELSRPHTLPYPKDIKLHKTNHSKRNPRNPWKLKLIQHSAPNGTRRGGIISKTKNSTKSPSETNPATRNKKMPRVDLTLFRLSFFFSRPTHRIPHERRRRRDATGDESGLLACGLGGGPQTSRRGGGGGARWQSARCGLGERIKLGAAERASAGRRLDSRTRGVDDDEGQKGATREILAALGAPASRTPRVPTKEHLLPLRRGWADENPPASGEMTDGRTNGRSGGRRI
jgi:hypothetical protein